MQIDYRTQAKAVGHIAVAGITSRVLIELASSRAARAETARRHGPIIAIWVLLVKRFIYPVANNYLSNLLNPIVPKLIDIDDKKYNTKSIYLKVFITKLVIIIKINAIVKLRYFVGILFINLISFINSTVIKTIDIKLAYVVKYPKLKNFPYYPL